MSEWGGVAASGLFPTRTTPSPFRWRFQQPARRMKDLASYIYLPPFLYLNRNNGALRWRKTGRCRSRQAPPETIVSISFAVLPLLWDLIMTHVAFCVNVLIVLSEHVTGLAHILQDNGNMKLKTTLYQDLDLF